MQRQETLSLLCWKVVSSGFIVNSISGIVLIGVDGEAQSI